MLPSQQQVWHSPAFWAAAACKLTAPKCIHCAKYPMAFASIPGEGGVRAHVCKRPYLWTLCVLAAHSRHSMLCRNKSCRCSCWQAREHQRRQRLCSQLSQLGPVLQRLALQLLTDAYLRCVPLSLMFDVGNVQAQAQAQAYLLVQARATHLPAPGLNRRTCPEPFALRSQFSSLVPKQTCHSLPRAVHPFHCSVFSLCKAPLQPGSYTSLLYRGQAHAALQT